MSKLALAVSVTAILSRGPTFTSIINELWSAATVHAHWTKYNKLKYRDKVFPVVSTLNNNVKHFYYYVRRNY